MKANLIALVSSVVLSSVAQAEAGLNCHGAVDNKKVTVQVRQFSDMSLLAVTVEGSPIRKFMNRISINKERTGDLIIRSVPASVQTVMLTIPAMQPMVFSAGEKFATLSVSVIKDGAPISLICTGSLN